LVFRVELAAAETREIHRITAHGLLFDFVTVVVVAIVLLLLLVVVLVLVLLMVIVVLLVVLVVVLMLLIRVPHDGFQGLLGQRLRFGPATVPAAVRLWVAGRVAQYVVLGFPQLRVFAHGVRYVIERFDGRDIAAAHFTVAQRHHLFTGTAAEGPGKPKNNRQFRIGSSS